MRELPPICGRSIRTGRPDIAAAAIHHGMTVDALNDLDLSYTPPLGSPWDAIQHGAQAWVTAWSRAASYPASAPMGADGVSVAPRR